ncbi:MAG TPA: hypothetical protein VIK66_12220 [Gaiellaceae bacterium]|jgi:hypothetical protein
MTKIACTLTGSDLAEQARRWRALPLLQREETEDGLRVTFAREPRGAEGFAAVASSVGVEDELRALVAVENDCCRWARWDVEDGVVLVVTSSGHGVRTLHGMFRE